MYFVTFIRNSGLISTVLHVVKRAGSVLLLLRLYYTRLKANIQHIYGKLVSEYLTILGFTTATDAGGDDGDDWNSETCSNNLYL